MGCFWLFLGQHTELLSGLPDQTFQVGDAGEDVVRLEERSLQGLPVGHAGHHEGCLHPRFLPHADVRLQTVADEETVRRFEPHCLQGHLHGDGRGLAHDDLHLL